MNFRSCKNRVSGFSLVEIMVALVIGMIGVLIIMQVARTGEAQKRVTTGSGEAQNNAALGLYSVERDLKQAGYGFSSVNILCRQLKLPKNRVNPELMNDFDIGIFAPVVINSGKVLEGDEGTDTVLVMYGNSAGSPEGDIIVDVATVGTDQHIGVQTAKNFIPPDTNDPPRHLGEWVAAAPHDSKTDPCNEIKMVRVTRIDGGSRVVVPDIDAKGDQQLFDLGLSPRIVGYAIHEGNLTMCDYMLMDCAAKDNWISIANNVVSLQAQYRQKGGTWNQTTPTDAEGWGDISAVRLVLVARNAEFSRDPVTTDANKPEWAGGSITLPGSGDEWTHYRYQTYETVIPLRNIPWMGAPEDL